MQVRDAVASGALVELLFYTSHRLLHTKYLYPYHKLHHGYKAPIALAALYAHPLEAILGNTLAVMAPAASTVTAGCGAWPWGSRARRRSTAVLISTAPVTTVTINSATWSTGTWA